MKKVDIIPNRRRISIWLYYECPEGVDEYLSYELSFITIETQEFSRYVYESTQTGFGTTGLVCMAAVSGAVVVTSIRKRKVRVK